MGYRDDVLRDGIYGEEGQRVLTRSRRMQVDQMHDM
jgi:hypothetical protein